MPGGATCYAVCYTVGLHCPRKKNEFKHKVKVVLLSSSDDVGVGGDPVDDGARQEAGLADAIRCVAPSARTAWRHMPWPRAARCSQINRSPRAVIRATAACRALKTALLFVVYYCRLNKRLNG